MTDTSLYRIQIFPEPESPWVEQTLQVGTARQVTAILAGHDGDAIIRRGADEWDRESWQRSQAAAILGVKGGAAGRGAAKRRDVDYAALARKSHESRKPKT